MEKAKRPYTPKDPELVSLTMSHIRGKDTKIELRLRKALHAGGFRYSANSSGVYGHPDIVNKRLRLAIFVDGEFWHGYNFDKTRESIKKNESFWIGKIERNMERDLKVNEELHRLGYTVMRFWGHEVEKELGRVVKEILDKVEELEKINKMIDSITVRTTLGYLKDGDNYLMLNRNKKSNDLNSGKWIGIGGHIEPNESVLACMKRETKEETGLEVDKAVYLGSIDFLNDKYPAERMYLYRIDKWRGEMIECDEGTLAWINKDKIMDLPLWEGDKVFLPYLENSGKPWKLSLIYEDNRLIKVIGPYWEKKNEKKRKTRKH